MVMASPESEALPPVLGIREQPERNKERMIIVITIIMIIIFV